jgi:hypothetical protein
MGYFLLNGNCTQMNILCMQADSKGNCIKCYNDFTLLNNSCYSSNGVQSANSLNIPTSLMDPLCEQYSGGACANCTSNTYMSSKLNKCVIKDPNSLSFDTINEVALECVRGYTLSP